MTMASAGTDTTLKRLGKTKIPVLKRSAELLSQFSPKQLGAINKMKEIYLKTVRIDAELQENLYELEYRFQEKHRPVYDERAAVLAELRKTQTGDGDDEGPLFHDFWLRVLKNSYAEFISKKDEAILMHLTDIRSILTIQPTMHFVIEFHFEKNDYFTDRVLRKTYHMNYHPDAQNPLGYDGAEIYRSVGCKINWTEKGKKAEAEREDFGYSSFFDFFSPPELPTTDDDPNYCQINTILQNDYELGFYLKERVIPKAILFYTGEANDCQSDSDGDDSASEDSPTGDEDEAEEESSNETDENPPNMRSTRN